VAEAEVKFVLFWKAKQAMKAQPKRYEGRKGVGIYIIAIIF